MTPFEIELQMHEQETKRMEEKAQLQDDFRRAVERIGKLENEIYRYGCNIELWKRMVIELTQEKYIALAEVDRIKELLGE